MSKLIYTIPILTIILILIRLNKKNNIDLITIIDTDYKILEFQNVFKITNEETENMNLYYNFHIGNTNFSEKVDENLNKTSLGAYYPTTELFIQCKPENAIKVKNIYDDFTKSYQDGSTSSPPEKAFLRITVLNWDENDVNQKIQNFFYNNKAKIAHVRFGIGIDEGYAENEIIYFVKETVPEFVKQIQNKSLYIKNSFCPNFVKENTKNRNTVFRNDCTTEILQTVDITIPSSP